MSKLLVTYQIVSGTFYGEPVSWIHQSIDGHLNRSFGPYWSVESAQAQIKNWETQEATVE